MKVVDDNGGVGQQLGGDRGRMVGAHRPWDRIASVKLTRVQVSLRQR
jgi:hypothetical protein